MKPVYTALQTLRALLAVASVAAAALRRDAADTFENFSADILLTAAATVTCRMFLVRRARSQESRSLSDALNDVRGWFATFREQVKGARSWSARQHLNRINVRGAR